MKEIVSIIIPTYNRSSLLKETVESCLNQTYSSLEIIIIDDGSTDDTETIVNYLKATTWKYKPVKYYKQNNAGASAARNKGIDLATGDYIQFLDSDDLLFPDKIEIQLKAILQSNADGCSCYGVIGKSKESKLLRLGESFNSISELIQRLLMGVHVMSTPAPLWRSSFIKSQVGWNIELGLGDDLEYHIRLLTKAKHISFVEKELFFVREHDGEKLSVINRDINKIDSLILTRKIIHNDLISANLWTKEMQQLYINSLRTHYAIALMYYNKKQLLDFENWLSEISREPIRNNTLLNYILIRKIFGSRFILLIHSIYKKLRTSL